MSNIITAGNASNNGTSISSDTSGVLELKTGSSSTTALTIGTDQSVTFAQSVNVPNTFGFKNRIINGAMMIDQRNAGAAISSNAAGSNYTVDRWEAYGEASGKFSAQQNAGSVTPPSGFKNYLGITSLTANTPATGDSYILRQWIEGFNSADLGFGAAGASTVTLSFWVRSSLTGTFSGVLTNYNQNRAYPYTYTISSANTWEQKSITIVGDTSGTWLTTNSGGIGVIFNLGSGATRLGTANAWATVSYVYGATGSTNVLGTNGATFYITGVQLEKGSVATSFDYRPYGTELILCERYYDTSNGTLEIITPAGPFTMRFATIMRATPTLSTSQNFGSISDLSVQKGSFRAQSTAIAVLSYTASAEL